MIKLSINPNAINGTALWIDKLISCWRVGGPAATIAVGCSLLNHFENSFCEICPSLFISAAANSEAERFRKWDIAETSNAFLASSARELYNLSTRAGFWLNALAAALISGSDQSYKRVVSPKYAFIPLGFVENLVRPKVDVNKIRRM
jgi:hypothetical protein